MSDFKKITIAIDGYSSCGKSTMAKALAKELGYIFIDSGAMYRGVTLYCMRHNLFDSQGNPIQEQVIKALPFISINFEFNASKGTSDLILNAENVENQIRMPDVAAKVSAIASIKEVREKLVEEQRKLGVNGGIVMDGRDIGSVVFPNAELKLFVTANPEIRAQRRYAELVSKNIESSYEEVLKNLIDRDHLDSTRSESPLVKTSDAIEIDTSELTPQTQLAIAAQFAYNSLLC
jgi:cytidylate kinase